MKKFNRFAFRFFTRSFSTIQKEDLPLLPKMVFVHKTLKKIYPKSHGDLHEALKGVREIPWRHFDSLHSNPDETFIALQRLDYLLSFENKLPSPLPREFANYQIFQSLRDARECFIKRQGLDNSIKEAKESDVTQTF